MTGLGKGLDALFASTVEEEKKEEEIQSGEKIHKLKLIECPYLGHSINKRRYCKINPKKGSYNGN